MTDPTRSEIYDLGYRNYDGPRLGRRYAVKSLIVLSLRNVFGLGRGPLPKVLAFTLAFFAYVPAIIQLILGAVVPNDFEFVTPEDMFASIQVILVLFVAAMSSDLVGNDRKNNTLVLYFSRPIERDDYVLAKITALAIALLALTLLPQLLAFVGNWLGANDSTEWFTDNVSDLFGIFVSSILVSAQLAAIGVVIASFASRRAFALISVIAIFLFTSVATGILVDLLPRVWGGIVMCASPLHMMQAVSLVVFDAVPSSGSASGGPTEQIASVDFPGFVWVVALVAQTAIATGFAIRRYRSEV